MSARRVVIELRGEVHVLSVGPGETIFAAVHREGLMPPFSCVAGYCGACRATVEEGGVEMEINRALSPRQLARGLILTCQSTPGPDGCRVRFVEDGDAPPC